MVTASDRYLTWFGGSLLWPVVAGLGYRAAGLVGARALAVLAAGAALAAGSGAARNLFGPKAGLWTALTFAVNGAFLGLGRLAVYDALALAGIAVSFWAITQMIRRDHRGWLSVAAVAFVGAFFAKYPMALMGLPLVGITLALRRDKAPMDIAIFGFLGAAMGLAVFLPLREQIAAFFAWRLANKPAFGVTPAMIAAAIVYLSAAPLALTVAGWIVAARQGQRWLPTILLLSMLIWPAYHLGLQDPVSVNKHLAFGFLFAYPLIGLALSAWWDGSERGARPRLLRRGRAPWLAVPFALASLMTGVMTLVTVINHWQSSAPQARPAPAGQEPDVSVIIPTYGELPEMVYRTARSVLEQDYPQRRLHLLISDDGRSPKIRALIEPLQRAYPQAQIGYHTPPRRGDPQRRGEAKAGNLNSALDLIEIHAPEIRFIETRDADDEVGAPDFLRQAVGQMMADRDVAFVQTIKEAQVSPGDPFGNLEPLFYRKAMLAKNAANAVFPCGSGLVWRRQALDEIGGFPTWSLVEDLQSGAEALRRGWRGVYLPIVGAVGQTAPEDVPNQIKQRGTWAVDTMRLTFWWDKRGLNLRQHSATPTEHLSVSLLPGWNNLRFGRCPA
ncbi:MAG TPA: glycosyltransferase [Chloroflexi bacterium]|nr:glycosyltransferase [Chloroflexota bacterium]